MFITVFTRADHLCLSWVRAIQSMLSQVFSRSFLVLISKLRQNLSKPGGIVHHFVTCYIFRVQILVAPRTNPKAENHLLSVIQYILSDHTYLSIWRPNFVLKASKFFRPPRKHSQYLSLHSLLLTLVFTKFVPLNF